MCVCMYVCPAACRRTYTTYHPKIWRGLLISPGLSTEQGGNTKCCALGVPRIVTPSEKPWRVKNWTGASKQKLLLGVGLPDKILFSGGSPLTRAHRVHPTKWGVCFENWVRASKQKLLLGVGLYYQVLFVGGSPQPKACWVLRSICTGLSHNEIVT
jgi:hypothetical protein